ncbi:MAG: hypothetical protein JWL72_2253 [Ilumatobacteraceae bacterium]|nr:hypothetical protein [Ilumatobacteraceae bacterium]
MPALTTTLRRRVLTIAIIGSGVLATPAAALAVSSGSRAVSTTTTSTTTPTSTTTKPTTKTGTTTAVTYEVIAGTFHTKAKADTRLTAITNKKITGLSIVTIGKTTKRYRIEATGLTKTAAKALVKSLTAAKFFAYSVRR